MKWLALDTATDIASFAVKVDDTIFSREQEGVSSHAEKALPIIDDLLQEANVKLSELSGIIVGRGPGSFTGLRVACAITKGLAVVHQLPVYGLSNLAVIAAEARKLHPNYAILSVIDARMQQVYWAYYKPGQLEANEVVSCMSNIDLPSDAPVVLAGFNFEPYMSLLPSHFNVVETLSLRPHACDMIQMVEAGGLEPISAEALEPHYVRNQVTHGGL